MNEKTEYLISLLAKRLKSLRLKMDITQKELSKRAGVTVNTVQNAEKGECTLKTFVAIMEALDQGNVIENLLPEQLPSPLKFASTGVGKIRASGKRSRSGADEVDW